MLYIVENKGYLSHLIIPQDSINAGTAHTHQMFGIQTEVMPLDAYLNQDVHKLVNMHVNLISHLPYKFSKQTPTHLGST